ncbi:biopolymer transporter ExbB [Campylobacter sp. MIT 12-5580]|uniref:MotA/TolQ/ExbB proton channel family protein n=1 Tax=Campylobacter sp. MIT 12-5580 TaxID=2040651 RepID=UPI0010F82BC7|nr:MotA/TolQ/ExbB proton channel family protein [Campylobacter sp. MIT 12-5580]TKX28664.1 biopolymer transporter ExbB [Campylobacter sp. MIT 12-5580]
MNTLKSFFLLSLLASLSFTWLNAEGNLSEQDLNLNQAVLEQNSTEKTQAGQMQAREQEPHKTLEFSLSSLYSNADAVVKSVIVILVLFSVLSWAVFFAKSLRYNALLKMTKKDKQSLSELSNLDQVANLSPLSLALVQEIQDERQKSEADAHLEKRIQIRLESKLKELVFNAKLGIALLASIGSSAPFIGLFGTVWGIMNAFIGISKNDSVSLAVVAPGIAEALFATAFGLAAAIPAVLFYNYLLRLSIKFAQRLDENATMLFVMSLRGNKTC